MRKTIFLLTAGLSLAPATTAALAAGDGEGGGELHLVEMDELSVPIVDASRADGALRIKLVLETVDGSAAARAAAELPTLRAASLAAAVEFARLYASPMAPVDAERLATDMTAALHEQDKGISRVLIVEVLAQHV